MSFGLTRNIDRSSYEIGAHCGLIVVIMSSLGIGFCAYCGWPTVETISPMPEMFLVGSRQGSCHVGFLKVAGVLARGD